MKKISYHGLMKKLSLVIFAFILINVVYSGAAFAITQNTMNISESHQTNLTQIHSPQTNLTSTSNRIINSTVKNTGINNQGFSSIQGYFINPADTAVSTVNPTTLKARGITDIFVLTNRKDPNNTLKPFLAKFTGSGIHVYAWVEAFKDFNGNWYNPENNAVLEKQIINDITSIATNYNVNGVMLDYLRFPGTAYKYPRATSDVNSFTAEIKNNINTINKDNIPGKPKILLSAALMPEDAVNDYYYGQNYNLLSNYLDFLSPMIYKGNYNKPTSWIGTTTQYIKANDNGKPVVAILQSYSSDTNPTPLTTSQLNSDISTAINKGSYGYELFRYGLTTSNFLYHINLSPKVETINPTNNGFNVPANQIIKITFSKLIKAGNMCIELKNSNGVFIPINKSVNGNVLTITHSKPFKIGKYTLTLHTGSVTDLVGNKLAPWGSNFNVIKLVPKISSTSPNNNAYGVSLTSPITIKFNENIISGINFSKIYIKNLSTGKIVPITKTISLNTLIIKQTLKRLHNDIYEVYIRAAAIKDQAGNNLAANYMFKFKTVK